MPSSTALSDESYPVATARLVAAGHFPSCWDSWRRWLAEIICFLVLVAGSWAARALPGWRASFQNASERLETALPFSRPQSTCSRLVSGLPVHCMGLASTCPFSSRVRKWGQVCRRATRPSADTPTPGSSSYGPLHRLPSTSLQARSRTHR